MPRTLSVNFNNKLLCSIFWEAGEEHPILGLICLDLKLLFLVDYAAAIAAHIIQQIIKNE